MVKTASDNAKKIERSGTIYFLQKNKILCEIRFVLLPYIFVNCKNPPTDTISSAERFTFSVYPFNTALKHQKTQKLRSAPCILFVTCKSFFRAKKMQPRNTEQTSVTDVFARILSDSAVYSAFVRVITVSFSVSVRVFFSTAKV